MLALLTAKLDGWTKLIDIYKIQGRINYFENLRDEIKDAFKFEDQNAYSLFSLTIFCTLN